MRKWLERLARKYLEKRGFQVGLREVGKESVAVELERKRMRFQDRLGKVIESIGR